MSLRTVARTIAWALALCVAACASAPVPVPTQAQAQVFFNARLSLREEQPTLALRLWLLRNSLVDQGRAPLYDDDFRSVTWAALGSLGLCQDGFPTDEQGGAGLWPLALHNQVVRSLSRGEPPDQPTPFDAFEVGRQQRLVSLHDVLSSDELRSVAFFRTSCLLPRLTGLSLLGTLELDLSDRLATGRLLRALLVRSLKTLRPDKVNGTAAIEARIFDLDLALASLALRRAQREGQAGAQRARSLGSSAAASSEVRDAISKWPATSAQAAFLRNSLTWRASEWLTLSRARRLSLFAQARPLSTDPSALLRLELELIDALLERGDGAEVEAWLGNLDAEAVPARRAAVITGERGKRLLALAPESGFRERAVIALERGVAFLSEGRQDEALRSLAYALGKAEESREATAITALARRWLSFVLASYQTDEAVVTTLRALLPRQEQNAIFGDLAWRAALRADLRSFERASQSLQRGGTLDAQVSRLTLLAQGKPGELGTSLRDLAEGEPYFTLRFVRVLLERLEAEEAQVRRANAPLLRLVPGILAAITGKDTRTGARARAVEELAGRAQAILEGLELLDSSAEAKARSLAPGREAFAGSVRMAPADPLPWPFRAPEPEAPSVFIPLLLQPVEWRGAGDRLVFGWRIAE